MNQAANRDSGDQHAGDQHAEGQHAGGQHAGGQHSGGRGSRRAKLPNRTHPAHGVLAQPDQPTIVCVTVCTKNRKRWLTNTSVHDQLVTVWNNATAWSVGRYVVMPDHIHLFAGENGDIPLDNWVRYWKSQFSKQHGNPKHRWQTDHWDRRMRSAAEYEDAWNYMFRNPVRAGLVQSPEQWHYAGEIHDLRWD